ncbi:hypothetical protein AAF712_005246 [Marasmius tenuissimus]|uniref:MYND-type domain-containing protein n=1 Tax=Marasmius tenuissimus TaxID=585030 RepID=A0ABR3A1D6_9AGAR|nr:hypothetical protein PM082_022428 [Marasmius tenuissimus]
MYSQPAAANYYTPPAQYQKPRGYRICDRCGVVETPASRFRLCGGCMITQYCSPECQKIHWPGHKSICQHTQSQKQRASASYAVSTDEDIVKNLRRFTSAHTTLLGWAGFQALQLKRVPSNIRQSALLIQLTPQSHPQSHRRFSIAGTHIVNPRKFIRDPLVLNDVRDREERCRRNGGIGTLIIILQCGDVSQVLPVEVDPPSQITWDAREDWPQVLHHFVESGRTDFQPISTTSGGIYYG